MYTIELQFAITIILLGGVVEMQAVDTAPIVRSRPFGDRSPMIRWRVSDLPPGGIWFDTHANGFDDCQTHISRSSGKAYSLSRFRERNKPSEHYQNLPMKTYLLHSR